MTQEPQTQDEFPPATIAESQRGVVIAKPGSKREAELIAAWRERLGTTIKPEPELPVPTSPLRKP